MAELDDLQNLLDLSWDYADGLMAATIVLDTWLALRPFETLRTSRANLNLDDGVCIVQGGNAKTRTRRPVDIPPNALLMLRELEKEGKLEHLGYNVYSSSHWSHLRSLAGFQGFEQYKNSWVFTKPEDRRRSDLPPMTAPAPWDKLKPWPSDVLRHTGISYHLAYWKKEGDTALWAGNSPAIIHRNYKGLVRQLDALRFWTMLSKQLRARGLTAELPNLNGATGIIAKAA